MHYLTRFSSAPPLFFVTCPLQGFCTEPVTATGSWGCTCSGGWTGDDCSVPVLLLSNGFPSGGSADMATHPAPATCIHGAARSPSKDPALASALRICRDRTSDEICAPPMNSDVAFHDGLLSTVLLE